MKERITILNPRDTHDGIIELVLDDGINLHISTDFLVETRTTDTVKPYDHIDQLRVQVIGDIDLGAHNVFGYNYAPGFLVYAQPRPGAAPEDFFAELAAVLARWDDVTIERDEWVTSSGGGGTAVYFHNPHHRIGANGPAIRDIYLHGGTKVVKTVEYAQRERLHFYKKVDHYTELGVFLVDPAISTRDDLVLLGLRWVLDPAEEGTGEPDLFETLFHVKPRHRVEAGATAHTEVVPLGLHPVLRTSLSGATVGQGPRDDDVHRCRLYYYANVNKNFIFDRYQLVPQGAEVVALHGETDLELPVYKVAKWGTEVLFEFAANHLDPIELTLHLRYQAPDPSGPGVAPVTVAPPVLFWGCDVLDGALLGKLPLDNKRTIGGNYEAFFTDDTVFYHVLPALEPQPLVVEVPVAHHSYDRANVATTTAVALGVVMILFTMVARLTRAPKKARVQAKAEPRAPVKAQKVE